MGEAWDLHFPRLPAFWIKVPFPSTDTCFFLKYWLFEPKAGGPDLVASSPLPGEGNGTPLQYSCLENPMDGGAWCCSPWGHCELDTTERLRFHFSLFTFIIGEGNGNPLQCYCLENPRDGGAWWAAVYGVAQSRTRLKWLSSSSSLLPLASQYSNTKNKVQLMRPSAFTFVKCFVLSSELEIEKWAPSLDLDGNKEKVLAKGMATHSSILSWRILWTEEPEWLQPMG